MKADRNTQALIDGYICAANMAETMITLTLLADHYGADAEWLGQFIDRRGELQAQYDAGVFTCEQMQQHLLEDYGIDCRKFSTTAKERRKSRK